MTGPMANYPRTANRYADNAFAANKRGKLERLQTHLKTISPLSREVTLTFAQVERILGGPLPVFAKSQPAWWDNQPQADFWQGGGLSRRFGPSNGPSRVRAIQAIAIPVGSSLNMPLIWKANV